MKTITIDINAVELLPYAIEQGENELIEKIYATLLSNDFIEYIGRKANEALQEIAIQEVQTISDDKLDGIGAEKIQYLNSMKMEIKDNQITLYNDATIDLTQKILKPTTLARYSPPTLSLARIIEYGIGYTGASHSISKPEDWTYDLRQHGNRGWYYLDTNRQLHWTNGLEGRYVFLKLIYWFEENAKQLVTDYLNKNI